MPAHQLFSSFVSVKSIKSTFSAAIASDLATVLHNLQLMKPEAFPCKTSCKNTLLCDWWTGIVFKELCLIKKKRRELHDSEKSRPLHCWGGLVNIHSEPAKHLWNRRVIILVYIIYKKRTFDDQHGRRLTERRVNQVTILKEEMKRRIWHYYFFRMIEEQQTTLVFAMLYERHSGKWLC